jgi:hemerythrin-like metal-binding protein
MAIIVEWDSSYSVGNALLDRQHQKLLDLCNELARHTQGEQAVSRSRFHEILNELTLYARQHFKIEETLLTRMGYTDVSAQVAEHLAYDEKVVDWSFDATVGELNLAQAHDFLARWWKDHILVSDMQYKPLMEAALGRNAQTPQAND